MGKTRYLELSEHLAAAAQEIENKRSAEHSRLLILAAGAQLAGKVDVPGFRIPDVCAMCGISRATFYLHFSAKEDLFVELMQHLTELECSLTPSLADCTDVAAGLERIVDWYLNLHMANASLFANLTYLNRSNAAISESWRQRAKRLHVALFAELERFDQIRVLDKVEANFVLEFFGRAMNSLVNQFGPTAVLKNPYLPTDVAVAKRAVSKAFYRSFFGFDPKPANLARLKKKQRT